MNSETQSFFKQLTPELDLLAQQLMQLLLEIEPGYDVGKAWSGLAFKRGNNYSCLIAPYKDHLKLMLWRGVDLSDPSRLLQGKGANTRHIRLTPGNPLPVDELTGLLKQQFDRYDRGERWESPPKARPPSALPPFVGDALTNAGLNDAYRARPAYQRRDYLSWILGAKRPATREQRLQQMLEELHRGDVYMKQAWNGRR